MIYRCEQGTDEWKSLRLGRVTGSRVSDVMAKIQKGEAAGRRNYRAEVVCEVLTGTTAEGYVSKEMQWGTDQEPFARVAYELGADLLVEKIGFATHPNLDRFGASPDGLVGEDGLVELKCPNTATHIDYLLRGVVPAEYHNQMLSEMACTERVWCDFVSYDPRMPKDLQKFVRRFYRDDARIKEIETMVTIFITEVDDVVSRLRKIAEQSEMQEDHR